jgi:hypothetical protein
MKKATFKVCMMLAAASCFVACDKENPEEGKTTGKAKLVLACDMAVNGSDVGYL